MQNSGQYGGVSDAPQYVVGRQAAPPHIFSISHDSMSIATPAAHALHHHHHLQQQAQHHYGHPSLQQIQQQHPQFSQLQDAHQQQQREREREREQLQQREQQQREQQQREQQQAAAQQAMVQQLGLGGGPDSPEVPSPGVSRPSPTKFGSQQQQLVVGATAVAAAAAQEDDGMEDEGRSAGGNRWPRQETLALIKIRSEMDSTFRDSGLKGPLWEEVSRKLAEQGYSRTAKKCKEKFENVHKYYKKTKDGKAGRQDGKSYRFFSQLEALYCGQEAAMQLGSRLAASAAASLLTDSAAAAAAVLTGSAAPASKVDNGMIQQQQQQQQRQSEVTLSESMSEDEEDYDEEPSSKKHKRDEGVKEDAHFFSALMKNLVEKQESMQQRFLEFMERREQERQARDESWRRQELARVAREHELRVQEQQLAATRDAALVAFLQKVTGQTLSLPQIPPPPPPTAPPAVDSTLKTHQTPTPQQQLVTVPDAVDDSPIDPNSKRWPKPEVLTLIKLRSDMEPRFQEPGPKAPLWEEISQAMACLGYNRNQKRCKEKWENINKYFRKTKESNKKRPENAKTCPYFHQLELLYMKGVLGTPHNKKLAPVDSEKVDHQAVPLAQRIEAAATGTPTPSSETVLKMIPVAADAVQNAAANSGNGSGHLFSSPENGSSGAKAHVSETST